MIADPPPRPGGARCAVAPTFGDGPVPEPGGTAPRDVEP